MHSLGSPVFPRRLFHALVAEFGKECELLTVWRNLSGESMHKRGYRPVQVKSPLNEATAAGIVRLSEWDQASPLVDPMCGSGTLLIEAALPDATFARTHRSHIVRIDAIAAIRGTEGEREITLSNGDAVPLSRRFAQARDWRVSLHFASAKAIT